MTTTQSSVEDLPVWAVIPATGVGSRMGADRPKQYLRLGQSTILELTLDRILSHPAVVGAVAVLSASDEFWPALNYSPAKPVLSCVGGAERYHSVLNGLQRLSAHLGHDALVMIHDAVRPLVSHDDLTRVIAAARSGDDGAILAVAVADTLKFSGACTSIQETRPRDGLWRAFTPQVFRLELIQAALHSVIQRDLAVTDDASAMEAMGFHPVLVACDPLNIKITHAQDLPFAELILRSQQGR